MSNRTIQFFAIFWLIFSVGCADSTVRSNTDLKNGEGGTPSITDEYFMVPASSANILANVTDSTPLEVYLYSKKSGNGAADQKISYEIVEAVEGSSLAALQAITGEEGKASVELRASPNPAIITVRASHPSANSIDFIVDVQAMTVGSLEVTPINTAPSIMRMQDIEIRLYRDSEFSCNEFRPFFAQPEALKTLNVGAAGQPATFENLGTLDKFLITGLARGDRGQIAAAACQDNVSIRPETVTQEDLLLQFIDLNPVGRYDVKSNWDFTDAIADSGTIGSIIVRVLNVFENPGRGIYNEIIALVDNLFGGIVGFVVENFLGATGLDDAFEDLINDVIAGNDVLTKIFQAGRDLRDVIANLEVSSRLTIGKISDDFSFRGSDNWTGITLYWRYNCDANSPADCGAIPLEADPDGEIGALGLVSSEWTGRVVAYNQLQIDTHTVSLRYGRLIIYILNNIIIPELTGGNATSLTEAFAYWIGCSSIATSITGSDGELCALGQCIRDDQIEGFCDSAVSTIFSFADIAIRGLEFDIGLRLGGEGVLVETTSDGRVDLIEEGTYTGFISSTDMTAATSPFSATWTATKFDEDGQGN